MPRPLTKAQLLSESQKEYHALEQFLAALTPDQITQPGAPGGLAADELFPHWGELRQAMDGGSVITRDAGVLALAGITAAHSAYGHEIFPYLLEHLKTCRPKDVPQHAEKTLAAVNAENKAAFIAVLVKRLDILQGTQVKRVQKVIRQAEKH